mmetsp:Transcript_47952/g.127003  ORF Transcript_47952/g.127003 Transcript_47952/m.127003 type:complete len:242 (+) Transcript_47952:315-1040(+)
MLLEAPFKLAAVLTSPSSAIPRALVLLNANCPVRSLPPRFRRLGRRLRWVRMATCPKVGRGTTAQNRVTTTTGTGSPRSRRGRGHKHPMKRNPFPRVGKGTSIQRATIFTIGTRPRKRPSGKGHWAVPLQELLEVLSPSRTCAQRLADPFLVNREWQGRWSNGMDSSDGFRLQKTSMQIWRSCWNDSRAISTPIGVTCPRKRGFRLERMSISFSLPMTMVSRRPTFDHTSKKVTMRKAKRT